ncbi:MAG: hypothetical protein ACOYNN_06475 [Terrimicrobiaceae bacterium]
MTAKEKLIAEVALSRNAIVRDVASVRAEVDVTARLRQSVKSRPFAWLGSAAALGYMLAGPKRRTKVVVKPGRDNKSPAKPAKPEIREPWNLVGTVFGLIKLLVPLVRPALSAYAARRIGDFAEKLGK